MRTWFSAFLVFACALPAIAAEGRIPVYLDGTVIAADGKYVLTRNIASAGGGIPVIDIQAPNVDLDLNGFTIFGGPGIPCIVINSSPTAVRIHNGSLVDADFGIFRPAGLISGQDVVIEDLEIRGMLIGGIDLGDVETAVIRRIRIAESQGNGIALRGSLFTNGAITDSTLKNIGGEGIRVEFGAAMEIANNRLEVIGNAAGGTGIVVLDSFGMLVAENTVVDVGGGDGIVSARTQTSKFRNNLVRSAARNGIVIDLSSGDNLLLDNVVADCGFASPPGHGIFVDGFRNHLEGNTTNANESCGLLFTNSSFLNVFGRNVARGNSGNSCAPCPLLFPPDSCDQGGANDTNLENMIPGPPPF